MTDTPWIREEDQRTGIRETETVSQNADRDGSQPSSGAMNTYGSLGDDSGETRDCAASTKPPTLHDILMARPRLQPGYPEHRPAICAQKPHVSDIGGPLWRRLSFFFSAEISSRSNWGWGLCVFIRPKVGRKKQSGRTARTLVLHTDNWDLTPWHPIGYLKPARNDAQAQNQEE